MKKWIMSALVAGVVGGAALVPSVASAADLDQTVCETTLGGVWSGGNTCTVTINDLNGQDVTVPSGITLVADSPDVPSGTAASADILISEGGAMQVAGTLSVIDAGTFVNRGTLTVTATVFGLGMPATNYGTITATGFFPDTFDNYGDATITELTNDSVWTNHCGATLAASAITGQGSVVDLTCSIAVTITPAPASGDQPLDVTWTVTLENDGDEALTSPQVALSSDGGTTAFATLVAPPTSGDAGTVGTLDVGETWTWTVDTTEQATVTVTATGAGTLEGTVITFPDDAEARAAATVTVTPTPTTAAPTTAAPTTAAPTTAAPTTAAPTTNTIDVGATLPTTGTSAQSTAAMAMVAVLLLLAGTGLLAIRRRV